MFRVEFFVEDKRLAEALRALTGLARGQPSVTPVANIQKGNGALKAASAGTSLAMFEKYLGARKSKAPLSPDDLRKWLKANGKSPASASALATDATKAGLIRRVGQTGGTQYHIIKKG